MAHVNVDRGYELLSGRGTFGGRKGPREGHGNRRSQTRPKRYNFDSVDRSLLRSFTLAFSHGLLVGTPALSVSTHLRAPFPAFQALKVPSLLLPQGDASLLFSPTICPLLSFHIAPCPRPWISPRSNTSKIICKKGPISPLATSRKHVSTRFGFPQK